MLFAVCKAGHYRSGSDCVICPGSTIKIMAGNAADCETDKPCDGQTTIPNASHTACGELPQPHASLSHREQILVLLFMIPVSN